MTAVQSLLSSWNSISPWKENSLWIPILGGSTIQTTTSHRFVWLWLYCETIQEMEIAKTESLVSGIHVRYYLERYHFRSERVKSSLHGICIWPDINIEEYMFPLDLLSFLYCQNVNLFQDLDWLESGLDWWIAKLTLIDVYVKLKISPLDLVDLCYAIMMHSNYTLLFVIEIIDIVFTYNNSVLL